MSRKSKAAEFVQEGYNMNVTITGRNVLVTEPMKNYAMEKLNKMDRFFSNRIIDAVVTMDIQKLSHRVDIFLKIGHLDIKCHADTDNMYASIDKAIDRLEAQLLRYKSKIQQHQARATKDIDLRVNVLRALSDPELMDINDDIEEENRVRMQDQFIPHQIVKKDVCTLRTLTDGEAILKMELSGDPFLIYIGEDTKQVKIIYPLGDGNFGVLESSGSLAVH